MYWAYNIYTQFALEGKTMDEIIAYFDNPLIHKKYVSTVLENIQYLRRPNVRKTCHKRSIKINPPAPHTKSYKIWKYIEDRGGVEFFQEQSKSTSLTQLGKEWGFEVQRLIQYKRDFITGRYYLSPYHTRLNSIRKTTKRLIPIHPRKIKKNLW